MAQLINYLKNELYTIVSGVIDLTGVENLPLFGINKYVQMTKFVRAQTYSGDITLVPKLNLSDIRELLHNPTPERVQRCMRIARSYTWKRASMISAHCEIEFALDKCVRKIRGEMIFQSALNGEGNNNRIDRQQRYANYSVVASPVQPLRLRSVLSYASHQQMLAQHNHSHGSTQSLARIDDNDDGIGM